MRWFFYFLIVATAIAAGCHKPVEEIRVTGDAVSSTAAPIKAVADDWPVWRGAAGDNKANGLLPPLQWSTTKNVLWRADVPANCSCALRDIFTASPSRLARQRRSARSEA